jgi:hypothetical protein
LAGGGNAEKRPPDPHRRRYRTGHVAGNLGDAARPPAVIDRDLEDTQAGTRRLHLHLQVPTVGLLPHIEASETIPADGAKRAHVRVANAVDEPTEQPRQATCQSLLRRQASLFRFPANARADDEVVGTVGNRREQCRDESGAVAAVAVQKDDHVAIGTGRSDTGPAGPAITSARLGYDARAGGGCARRGTIGAAVVNDDDFIDRLRTHLTHDVADRIFLVQRRDDDRNGQSAGLV